MTIGSDIAELRTTQGFENQEDFAAAVGYSRSVVANAETDRQVSRAFLAKLVETYPSFKSTADDYIASLPPRKRKSRKESEPDALDEMFFLRSSQLEALSGEWHALWETTVDQEQVLNTEVLDIQAGHKNRLQIANREISPENPEGGYLWIAECRYYDRQFILGSYIATESSVRAKGVLQLEIHPSGKYLSGQWIGCNFDTSFAHGLVVMAKEVDQLKAAMNRHRRKIESELKSNHD